MWQSAGLLRVGYDAELVCIGREAALGVWRDVYLGVLGILWHSGPHATDNHLVDSIAHRQCRPDVVEDMAVGLLSGHYPGWGVVFEGLCDSQDSCHLVIAFYACWLHSAVPVVGSDVVKVFYCVPADVCLAPEVLVCLVASVLGFEYAVAD